MVTIANAEENTFVSKLSDMTMWIGLTDGEAYGGSESVSQPNPKVDGWVWVTREPLLFTNWRQNEPTNSGGNEDSGLIFANFHGASPGLWNDGNGDNDNVNGFSPFVVEYDDVTLVGDLTNNGFVDADDLFVLLSHWDEMGARRAVGNIVPSVANTINSSDLFTLLANWTGPDPNPPAAAAIGEAAVPEPSAFVLAVVAVLGACCWRRGRRA